LRSDSRGWPSGPGGVSRRRRTTASAKALMRAMYDKFFAQGHPNGKNIGFGGSDRSGAVVWNALTELGEILKNDWKGREDLRLKARNGAPKWGNNDDRADLVGKRVFDFLSALVNATPNGHGGTFQAGFWSIDDDI